MNKKVIISIVAVILIIALAIVVGKNLSKGDTQPTNTNPVNNATATPNDENSTPTPETAFPETPTPDASRETPTPTPTVEPSTNPSPSVDISKMDKNQKIEYAQSIAKKTWEKNNTNRNVSYSYADRDNEGKYLIAVRDSSTMNELAWYKIDIKTGSCEVL